MALYGLPYPSSGFDVDQLKKKLEASDPKLAEWVWEGSKLMVQGDHKYIMCRLNGLSSQCGAVFFEGWDWAGDNVFEELLPEILKRAETIAKHLTYSRAYITHVNKYFKAELIKHKYVQIDEFGNKRSGNKVYVLSKNIA